MHGHSRESETEDAENNHSSCYCNQAVKVRFALGLVEADSRQTHGRQQEKTLPHSSFFSTLNCLNTQAYIEGKCPPTLVLALL